MNRASTPGAALRLPCGLEALVTFYSVFINVVPYVCLLLGIVLVHELGHFFVGRWCGVKVDAFSLGFGPEIAHYTDRKGTRWRLAALPLGGYVKFHGDANGASLPDADDLAAMPAAERSVTLHGQSVWRRIAIVAAGPAANMIFAFVIFAGLFHLNGRVVVKPEVMTVVAGDPADLAGFKPKDVIKSIDGEKIAAFDDMQRILLLSDGAPLDVVVDRAGTDITLTPLPRSHNQPTPFGPMRTMMIGVQASNAPGNEYMQTYSWADSSKLAVSEIIFRVETIGHFLKGLALGTASTDQLSGPIRIAQVTGLLAQEGIVPLIYLAGVLSVSIGFLNLLPIPMLDGGFLMFFAFEVIRGKALPERTQEVGYRIGITVVAALMIFVAYNDIARTVQQHWTKPAATAEASGK